MYISRVTTSPSDHLNISSWPPPFDQPTFMFGRFDVDAPGPDVLLGEALLHITGSDKPIAVVHHGYAAPLADGSNSAFMFGAHPEQHVLPPLGELALFLQEMELS